MHFITALSLVMSAAALTVTGPTKGSSVSQSDDLVITWSTVASDSQMFNIELALSTDASNQQTLEDNVSPSTMSYSTEASDFAPGNYTINLVGNTPTSSGILAQSGWFLITASSSASSARGSAAATTTTSGTSAAGGMTTSTSAARSGAASSGGASESDSPEASGSATPVPATNTSGAGQTLVSLASFMLAGALFAL